MIEQKKKRIGIVQYNILMKTRVSLRQQESILLTIKGDKAPPTTTKNKNIHNERNSSTHGHSIIHKTSETLVRDDCVTMAVK